MIVTCWPSLNLLVADTTQGLAFVAPVIVAASVVEYSCLIPVAPEVLPVIVAPFEYAWAVLIFKCVNKSISKRYW